MTDVFPTPSDTKALEALASTSEEPTEPEANDGKEGQEDDQSRSPNYWKGKYAESSKGAQEIATKYNALKAEHDNLRAEYESSKNVLTQLKTERQELEEKLRDEKPETFEAMTIRRELDQLKGKILSQESQVQLDAYFKGNVEAEKYRDALVGLQKANPDKSLGQLYDQYFRPTEEAIKKATKESKARATQVETGADATADEPVTGELPEDFNEWSLEKRKSYLMKKGILNKEFRPS